MSLTSYLRERRHRRQQSELFDRLIAIANDIPDQTLVKFIGQLARPIQTELILKGMDKDLGEPDMSADLFFFQGIGKSELRDYRRKVKGGASYVLDLRTDPVLPWPWHPDRIKKALSEYGPANGEPWVQDRNHNVSLWLPWRVGIVSGGNHSITAGVVFGEGTISPREVFDCTKLLDVVRTDGRYWYCSDKVIESVRDGRTAAIFEIGRRIPK